MNLILEIARNKWMALGSFLLIVSLIFSSCSDANVYFEDSKTLQNQTWSGQDSVAFEFDIEDTVQRYDFYMNMRITTSYEWANCYVFMELQGPDLVAFDTVQVPLADVTGRWKGKVSGSMVENNVLFMKNVRFPQVGKHKIVFVQGMRDNDLGEVSDIGLTIKKAEKL